MNVGVVVAARNAGAHLAATLSSIVSQDLPPHDVVVVDGGSTDDTVAIARRFRGVRVLHQVGLGLGAARNQGIAEVGGDLIAFCDADDSWTPGSLRLRTSHLRDHSEVGAVAGHMVTVALEGDAVPDLQVDRLGVPAPGLTPGALVVRRGVIDEVGPFSEELRIATDSEWIGRLRQRGVQCTVLADVVLRKGLRAQSLSTDLETYRREWLAVVSARLAHGQERTR